MPRTNHRIDKRTAKPRTTLSKKLQRGNHLLVRVLTHVEVITADAGA
jgi:hypothetical protein